MAKFEVMASEVVVGPLDDLGGRPQAASDDLKRPQGHIFTYNMTHDLGTASEAGLKWPQMASSGLNNAQ